MRTRRRRGRQRRGLRFIHGVWVGLLAPIIVGATLFFLSVAWANRGLSETQVVLYHPATYGNVADEVRVTKRTRGECFLNLSIANQGIPDAHRCFGDDNYVYDPCFGGVAPESVVCVSEPWTNEGVVLRVTDWTFWQRKPPWTVPYDPIDPEQRRYFAQPPDMSAPPFALRLGNGDECVFATGTSDVIAGIRANYVCDQGLAVGVPNRTHRIWKIRYLRDGHAQAVFTPIAVAWY